MIFLLSVLWIVFCAWQVAQLENRIRRLEGKCRARPQSRPYLNRERQ